MNNDERRIILYVDGSAGSKTQRDGKTLPIGWGVVALHDDTHHEIVKGVLPGNGTSNKQFEFYAFIEGVEYAISQGFKPHQISIHTDELQLYGAPFMLHRENYVATESVELLQDRLKLTCKRFGPDAYDHVVACLKEGVVSQVKASEFCLYHHRAHYLANAGRRAAEGFPAGEQDSVLAYDEWLTTMVFPFYTNETRAREQGIRGPFREGTNGSLIWDHIPPFTRITP